MTPTPAPQPGPAPVPGPTVRPLGAGRTAAPALDWQRPADARPAHDGVVLLATSPTVDPLGPRYVLAWHDPDDPGTWWPLTGALGDWPDAAVDWWAEIPDAPDMPALPPTCPPTYTPTTTPED